MSTALETIEAVVLETDGTFSVVARREEQPAGASALAGVREFADRRRR